MLHILAVVIRAIKDAADNVDKGNQIYFVPAVRGTPLHLYFAVGFNLNSCDNEKLAKEIKRINWKITMLFYRRRTSFLRE